MANSPDSSTTLASAELVQARISEKRLFEARFLFHKFSSTIEPQVSLRLEQLLEERIARAGQHFKHGRRMEEQQRYEEAERDYGCVLAIAVDYPSIDQVLQRIVVLRKLGPLQAPSSPVVGGEPSEQAVSVEMQGTEVPGRSNLRRHWKILVLSLFLVFVGSAALLLTGRGFLGSGSSEPPSGKSVASGSMPVVPPATNILAVMPETSPGQNERVEKMKEIVLPRVISPPIINAVTASPVKTGSVVKNTQNKKLPAEQPAVEEQSVIKAVIPRQGPVIKVPANNDAPSFAVEESSEIAQKAAAKEKKETGTAATVRDDQSSSRTIKARIYIVQAGDTLEAIAGKVYGDRSQWSSLAQANREQLGRPPYVLAVGEKIIIPPGEEAAKKHFVSPDTTDGSYTVVSGDSLGVIARKIYGSSRRWQRLYELNRDRLSSPSSLRVGQKLRTRKDSDASVDSDPVGE